MTDDIQVGKVAVDLFERYAERVMRGALQGAKQAKNVVATRMERTYSTYLRRLLERYGKGKSFFVRSEMVPLYNYFVPLDLGTELRRLERPDATALGKASAFSIIIGSGGSGKSMMMRHLVVSALGSGQRTPIPLELRDLNKVDSTLNEALLAAVQSFGLDADEGFLNTALNTGNLTILLDGFDEVEHVRRPALVREIRQLAQLYPSTQIVLSSRPDQALHGWDGFTEFGVLPLTLKTAVELVAKAPFDEAVKSLFIDDMKDRLFERHESFLSNPLLLSIMLLTYRDVADIPQKLSTFYGQAFDSLFHRHDAWKGGFQRDRHTELDVQEFGRAFAGFSLMSYDRGELSFTRSYALSLVDEARAVSMLSFDGEAFLDDAIQAVCLLIEDGLEITFAHRSFQDYFVARFIQSSPPDHKVALLQRFVPRMRSDDVIPLLFELDRHIVEEHYVLPWLSKLRKDLKVLNDVGDEHLLRYLKLKYESLGMSPDEEGSERVTATIRNLPLWEFERFMRRHYPGPQSLAISNVDDGADPLAAVFAQEFGYVMSVPITALRIGSAVFREMVSRRGTWSVEFLRALLNVQPEVEARLAENRKTLQQLLAVPRNARNTIGSTRKPRKPR